MNATTHFRYYNICTKCLLRQCLAEILIFWIKTWHFVIKNGIPEHQVLALKTTAVKFVISSARHALDLPSFKSVC